MKKITIFLIFSCWMVINPSASQITFPVTFTVVDEAMQHPIILFKGSFNGWQPVLMREDSPGIWTVVLQVGLGNHEWGCENQNGVWLVQGPNLQFSITGFGNISGQTTYIIPPPIPVYNVMFVLIDPGNGETGIRIRGDFTGWNNVNMTDMGQGRWEIRLPVQAGTWEWGCANATGEWLTDKYLLGGNRVVTVAHDGTVTGDTEIILPLMTPYQLLFQVNMTTAIQSGSYNPANDSVLIAGSFNAWGSGTQPMKKTADQAILRDTITIMGLNGMSIKYKYRIGTQGINYEFPEGSYRQHTLSNTPHQFSDYFNVRVLQNLPFSQNFTDTIFPQPGWMVFDADNDSYGWKREEYQGNGYLISESAVYINNNWIALTPDNLVFTPAIDLRGLQGSIVHLTYDVASGASGNFFAEKYNVLVNLKGASPDYQSTTLYTHLLTEEYKNWNYKRQVVNLSAYTGKIIFVAWQHTGCSDQYKLSIDNIRITNVTGISRHVNEIPFHVYPNPASGWLFVEACDPVYRAELLNACGETVWTEFVNKNIFQVDVAALPRGIYLIKIIDEQGNNLTQKVVIQ